MAGSDADANDVIKRSWPYVVLYAYNLLCVAGAVGLICYIGATCATTNGFELLDHGSYPGDAWLITACVCTAVSCLLNAMFVPIFVGVKPIPEKAPLKGDSANNADPPAAGTDSNPVTKCSRVRKAVASWCVHFQIACKTIGLCHTQSGISLKGTTQVMLFVRIMTRLLQRVGGTGIIMCLVLNVAGERSATLLALVAGFVIVKGITSFGFQSNTYFKYFLGLDVYPGPVQGQNGEASEFPVAVTFVTALGDTEGGVTALGVPEGGVGPATDNGCTVVLDNPNYWILFIGEAIYLFGALGLVLSTTVSDLPGWVDSLIVLQCVTIVVSSISRFFDIYFYYAIAHTDGGGLPDRWCFTRVAIIDMMLPLMVIIMCGVLVHHAGAGRSGGGCPL